MISKYLKQDNNYLTSQNLAAEEIILKKIAASRVSRFITIKGGIIMYHLSKNKRRVTRDIDFDLLRYPIDNNSIVLLVDQLNNLNDGIKVSINGEIEELHQEDYKGRRVHLKLSDDNGDELMIKLDIGVHTYHAIAQSVVVFEFGDNISFPLKANPCEQVFAEKLMSLVKFGLNSTRFKDIYDLYYLVDNNLLNIQKLKEILNLFISLNYRDINTIYDIVLSIEETLNDPFFEKEASKSKHSWVEVDYDEVKETIIEFLKIL